MTESQDKNKLIAEGSQLVSVTNQLKLAPVHGKTYQTSVAEIEGGELAWTVKPNSWLFLPLQTEK